MSDEKLTPAQRSKAWRQANPERVKKQRRDYYKAHVPEIRKQKAEYYQRVRKERDRTPDGRKKAREKKRREALAKKGLK